MSILKLDDRVGSGDLTVYFKRWCIPHQLCRLEYGDAAFTGNGPNGPIEIGIEIKRIKDALNCMTGGRFAGHQLPGLRKAYRYIWLVVEGQYGTDYDTGMLVERRGKHSVPICLGTRQFMYREFSSWLTTMETRGGVKVRRTGGRLETARLIASLHSWFTEKEWGEHRSHLAMETEDDGVDGQVLFKPSLTRRIAACLPGVGWRKSAVLAKRFANPFELICANQKELMECEGVGKVLAEKIQEALLNG